MSRPQVTITLGRSGQMVVKRPWATTSDGLRSDAPRLSGSKRFNVESNADDSLLSTAKRLRGDAIARNSVYHGPGDVRIGGNDLRLKLLRKRMSRRIDLEMDERKKMELREKVSRTIQSSGGPERPLHRNAPSTKGSSVSLQVESLRSSYNIHARDALRPKSPNAVPKISASMSSSRCTADEMMRLPSTRLVDASRNGYMLRSDFLDPSRPKGPAPMTVVTASTRTSMDAYKPMKEFPPASSSMLRTTYPDEHLTVSSLLNSLGLGKYAIHFQAEEVDMAVLKQMGDRDLKELGIPMGPRKKILLAMLAHSKRPA